MADLIQLDVVTPERRVVSERVESVAVPGANGELGILPAHSPLISQLQTGILSYLESGVTHQLHVSGGFVEVNHDRVSVLAEIAELPDEIDAAKARADKEQFEKALGSFSGSDEEFEKLRVALERAKVRVQLSSGGALTSTHS
jgi:F-type H+-transporting ATPase subunit epsilon